MRLSSHGEITNKTLILLEKIESIINVEIFVRKAMKISQSIKENRFGVIEKNGAQLLILSIKGEGKYIIRPDRRLTEKEIELIRRLLIEEGYLEEIVKEERIIEEEISSGEVRKEEQIQEERIQEEQRRKYRRFGISKQEREEIIILIIEEIIKEKGTIIRDLIIEIKKKFEELIGVEDYPYLLIWRTIKDLQNKGLLVIEKLDKRTFKIEIRREIGEERPQVEYDILTIISNLISVLEKIEFGKLIQIIEEIKNKHNVGTLIKFFKILLES